MRMRDIARVGNGPMLANASPALYYLILSPDSGNPIILVSHDVVKKPRSSLWPPLYYPLRIANLTLKVESLPYCQTAKKQAAQNAIYFPAAGTERGNHVLRSLTSRYVVPPLSARGS